MCQTLFSIPPTLFGIPVFGFGLLLGVWVLVSLVIMVWLVRKQGFNADTWGYVPILVVVAVVIVWLLPLLEKEGGLPIRGYGAMMLLAVLAATGLAAWRAKRLGLDPEMIFSLAIWVFVPGIIVARLFYVVEYWSKDYWPIYKDPENGGLGPLLGAMINVTEGGLVVYGSLFGATLGLILFVRKHRLPLLALCDLVAPSIMLGLAIGRIGCLLNGCCFGGPCNLAWAVTFPPEAPAYQSQIMRGQLYGFAIPADPGAVPEVRSVVPGSPAEEAGLQPGDQLADIVGCGTTTADDAHRALLYFYDKEKPVPIELADGRSITLPPPVVRPRSLPVHPTQLYSSINALLICLLLLAYDPFHRRDGELIALMLTLYAIGRFLLEIIRTDETGFLGTGLTISQNISLVVLVAAIALWFTILRQPPRLLFVDMAKGKPPGGR